MGEPQQSLSWRDADIAACVVIPLLGLLIDDGQLKTIGRVETRLKPQPRDATVNMTDDLSVHGGLLDGGYAAVPAQSPR